MEGSAIRRRPCYSTYTPSHWHPALFFVASLLGCGGVVGSGPPPPPPIVVGVTPSSANVLLGATQKFAVTVTNTTDTSVVWSVNGTPGGYAAAGTIDANGVYTAPGNLPAPASALVQATSMADSSKNSTAAVTIGSDVSVSIAPPSAAVELGAVQPFTATVSSAANPNRSVSWNLTGGACASASCGAVDSSGNYTAPQILPAQASASLVATSTADPSKSAAAAITITSTFSLSISGPTSVNAGTTANYTATLTPAPNSNPSRAISWSVSGAGCAGADCGTISSGGVYTAPALPPLSGPVQITATPLADPTKAASVTVAIVAVVSVTISPTSASLLVGTTEAFQATVAGARDTTVTWLVNGVAGGNVAYGTILNSQTSPDSTTYSAPLTLPTGGPVTVQAQSNANPSVSASATITILSGITVTVFPASATIAVNHTQMFSAAANNAVNQTVTWQVNGIPGGNPAMGQICAAGSNPCQPVTTSSGASVEYFAPAGVPSPNPVSVTATSQADPSQSGSAAVMVLPHILVSVQPGSAALAGTEQLRFTASVVGTGDQQVTWLIGGPACVNPAGCGSIDASGLFTAPLGAPVPNLIEIAATSAEDTSQIGLAAVTITSGPRIFDLSPTSAYAGSQGGFTLLVTGNNFSASAPGPGSTILIAGSARPTSCASLTECATSLNAPDLQSTGNISVQLQNPDGTLSNTQTFVVTPLGSGTNAIPLTPSSPASSGNDIVVVELSTNGGSGAPGNMSLTVGAVGALSAQTSTCVLGGSPLVIQRPASGAGTADLCVFSISGLSPSFNFSISGPPVPDIAVIGRAPLGLGIVDLTLLVPATAAPGSRTLFVENPDLDLAAGTGALEVR
jgi:hypothetical protein